MHQFFLKSILKSLNLIHAKYFGVPSTAKLNPHEMKKLEQLQN